MRWSEQTKRTFNRFRSVKRGYYSFWIFVLLLILSLFAEIFINNRALLVKFEGHYYVPIYGAMIPGKIFGLNYDYETNYRELKTKFMEEKSQNVVILPLVPFSATENDFREGVFPPEPPSLASKHYLGTDSSGRDILARLVYGFRISIAFSLLLLVCNYIVGISIGSMMGYFGGRIDMVFQRIIEIWSNLPFLYIIIIISSLIRPTFIILAGIMAFFGWMGMTWQMRTAVYKEKKREYTLAAKTIGASNLRIIFTHILPNTMSLIITFIPFSISSGIIAISMLDYLGFGLPPPTPSWGELLWQGTRNLHASWIAISVVTAMVLVLTMVTFIGESVREALDPKKYSYYE